MSIKYKLDDKQSRLAVKVTATGILAAFGHNPTLVAHSFESDLDFDPDYTGSSSFQITIRADSLEVTDNLNKRDSREIEQRTRIDVLEVDRFPVIRFTSTAITVKTVSENLHMLILRGDLSLHGVTNSIAVEAQLKIRGAEARLVGALNLVQSAYGIKRVTALGGALKVKDELAISIDLAFTGAEI